MGHLANSCVNTDLGFHSADHQKNRTTEKPSWISLSKKLINVAGKLRPGVVFMSGGITYDGHISKPGITELKVGSSENWYSRVC